MRFCRGLLVFPLFLGGAAPVWGQSIVLTPLLGAFAPAASLVESTDGAGSVSQATGIAGGLQFLVLFGEGRAGFEASLALSRSAIHSTLTTALPSTSDSLASIYLLGAKGRLRLTPSGARHEVAISAGVALAARSGPAAERVLTGLTRTGGVVGVGYRLALGDGVAFAVSVEDYIYRSRVREPATQRGPTQHDFFVGIGFALTVLDRR